MATPSKQSFRVGRLIVLIGFVVLFVAHQDQWYWTDDRLWFGFMPTGLLYHTVYSFAAAALWWLAAKIAWPASLETFASQDDQASPPNESEPSP